jgi:AsmA family protein
VKLEGNVTLGPPTYKADRLKLQVGESHLTGEVAFTPSKTEGAKSSLTGRLHLDRFDLEPYVVFIDTGPKPPPTEAAAAPTAAGTALALDAGPGATPGGAEDPPAGQVAEVAPGAPPAEQTSKKVFPDDPLPLLELRQLDADIEITADEFATRNVMYQDVKASLLSTNGVLKIDPFQATVGEGDFLATAKLDASHSPAELTVDVNMKDGTTRDFGGRYNLTIDVDGSGNSIAQIMAGLDGQVIVDVRDLDIKKSALTQFGRSLFDSLNPFDEEEEKSELTCAIVRLDIQDGIANANDRIVAQLTRVTWFGGGEINLKTEAIDLGVQSKPRKGLGISLGGLASLVHVGGTLANPKIQLDPKDVAVKYGQNVLTLATGGLFLLAKGLWDKSKANSDVCSEILALEEEANRNQEGATTPGEADDDRPFGLDADI